MRADETYTQCDLVRSGHRDTAWIPTPLARRHQRVKLRGPDGDWVDGWMVTAVYATVPRDRVVPRVCDHEHQHEVSDAYRAPDGHWVTPTGPKEKT
jgi:hypothetical protein